MTTATPTPILTRADLLRRLANGEALAAKAEAAGDMGKFQAAMERVHLRILQIAYTDERPVNAICPNCEHGETWPATFWQVEAPLWVCLAHYQWRHEEIAAEMAARDAGTEVPS